MGAMAVTRTAGAALVGAVFYGGVRVYWNAGHFPGRMSPVGPDLVTISGWGSVALCLAAALAVAATGTRLPRPLVVAAGWGTAAALAGAAAMLLLDVVGGVLPGLGIAFYPVGALSRAACAAAAVLVARTTLLYQRRTRPGRRLLAPLERTPGWAYVAAYAAMGGCLTRIGAQAWVGFDETPLASGVSAALFEAGFLLGGTLLPAALVHRFGRVWPRRVPGAAGRRVPRPLVLWPGAAISAGLVVYFGVMTVQMVGERLRGRNPFPPGDGLDLPETFFWIAVPGYLLWGLGMAVAAFAYARTSAPGERGVSAATTPDRRRAPVNAEDGRRTRPPGRPAAR